MTKKDIRNRHVRPVSLRIPDVAYHEIWKSAKTRDGVSRILADVYLSCALKARGAAMNMKNYQRLSCTP